MFDITDIDDGAGWEQQEGCEAQLSAELETARAELRDLIGRAIADGADTFDELETGERQRLTAQLIRASDPARAWDFIQENPESDRIPRLLADALAGRFGGYLGLESTGKQLLDALIGGALRYAEPTLRDEFEAIRRRGLRP